MLASDPLRESSEFQPCGAPLAWLLALSPGSASCSCFSIRIEMPETLLTKESGYSANKCPNSPVSWVALFSVPFLPVPPL